MQWSKKLLFINKIQKLEKPVSNKNSVIVISRIGFSYLNKPRTLKQKYDKNFIFPFSGA